MAKCFGNVPVSKSEKIWMQKPKRFPKSKRLSERLCRTQKDLGVSVSKSTGILACIGVEVGKSCVYRCQSQNVGVEVKTLVSKSERFGMYRCRSQKELRVFKVKTSVESERLGCVGVKVNGDFGMYRCRSRKELRVRCQSQNVGVEVRTWDVRCRSQKELRVVKVKTSVDVSVSKSERLKVKTSCRQNGDVSVPKSERIACEVLVSKSETSQKSACTGESFELIGVEVRKIECIGVEVRTGMEVRKF